MATEYIEVLIIMYIYHALINALSAHMIHINLQTILCTHVENRATKTIYVKYYMEKQTHKHTHVRTHTHIHAHTHTHTHTHMHTYVHAHTHTHTHIYTNCSEIKQDHR